MSVGGGGEGSLPAGTSIRVAGWNTCIGCVYMVWASSEHGSPGFLTWTLRDPKMSVSRESSRRSVFSDLTLHIVSLHFTGQPVMEVGPCSRRKT